MTAARHSARWSGVLLAAAVPLAGAMDPPATQPPPPSEAERLLFVHDHLRASRSPGSLGYRYVEEAEGQPDVNDRAVLTLAAGARGRCCNIDGDYLSGARAVKLPGIPDARANPVLLYFLEGEVRRLERTTKGQAAHFRRRIRLALADAATVSDGTIRWRGQSVPARIVRVAPFAGDPYRERFMGQAATEYAFVLSDAVPGGVYQLSATLPGPAAGAAALARRTLSLEEPPP
ncbi:MAG TPA: hypothetical protein VF522_02210 [Ramlibacter sp.]|uniref:hypothetical protein n=1 Tax=Ramlibacter sp. TaxID=1917967 RepID=UPI002ED2515E